MPYQITWEPRGIYVRYSGQVSDKEVALFAEEGQADQRFSDLCYVLHDFLACTGATHSEPVIQELAAIDSAASNSNPKIKIAVVAERDDVKAMVKAYLDAGFPGFTLRLFPSVELARWWLER
jgi:hypothetical protein